MENQEILFVELFNFLFSLENNLNFAQSAIIHFYVVSMPLMSKGLTPTLEIKKIESDNHYFL